ncbi:hypothetical protein BC936DRAFT_144392 [Jimgerdemannia flammicorona]|uniref:trans-L-3-hydroxyproline dehydratase n=1 Tax=Jimgerdemannia flammicorona TaxID=994334 RepID=A0A433DCK6_9FUNG|nr:hypothetical protein BC936DRAFT_144392 [Jimgerdemannia flammicorona]
MSWKQGFCDHDVSCHDHAVTVLTSKSWWPDANDKQTEPNPSMDLYTAFNSDAVTVKTVDMHTCGEPTRIVVSGYPELLGATVLDKRRYAKERLDKYRKRLMFEPRGHDGMYGALLIPEPDHPDAHIGVLFTHTEGYSTMCGHATIALGRFLIDTQDTVLFPKRVLLRPDPITGVISLNIQAPCGLVRTFVKTSPIPSSDTHPTSNNFKSDPSSPVRFLSVPSFCIATDLTTSINLPEGPLPVTFDIAFGGAYYCIVPATQLGLPDFADTPYLFSLLRTRAALLSSTVAGDPRFAPLFRYPGSATRGDLDFLYGTIVTDDGDGAPSAPSLSACIFAGAQVDRSPCGSGVSARVAVLYARGRATLGETKVFGSMLSRIAQKAGGGYFEGTPVETVKIGEMDGVVVEVAGKAWYSGVGGFVVEKEDRLGEEGFFILAPGKVVKKITLAPFLSSWCVKLLATNKSHHYFLPEWVKIKPKTHPLGGQKYRVALYGHLKPTFTIKRHRPPTSPAPTSSPPPSGAPSPDPDSAHCARSLPPPPPSPLKGTRSPSHAVRNSCRPRARPSVPRRTPAGWSAGGDRRRRTRHYHGGRPSPLDVGFRSRQTLALRVVWVCGKGLKRKK